MQHSTESKIFEMLNTLPRNGNEFRAAHTVNFCWIGFNVKIPYKGYEISLAADGGDIIVFNSDGDPLATFVSTTGESVKSAIVYIDGIS